MSFFALTGLANAVVNTFLGVYILIQKPQDPRHRTYAAYCLSLSIWSGFYFLWLTGEGPDQALFFSRLLMIGAIFIPITHYHHIATLFGPPKHHAKIIALGYALSVLFLFSNATPYFIQGTHATSITEYWPTPGILFLFYLVYFFTYLGMSIGLTYLRRRESGGVRRTQVDYILISTIIGYIGGSTNFPLWYDIPVLPYGNVVVPIVTATNGFILIRYRLLDVQTIFKKGLAYGLTFLLTLLPLFGAMLFAQHYFFGGINHSFSILLLGSFVVVALAFFYLKRKIESAVSRSFFASSYEVTQSLTELSRAVIQMLDLKEIGHKLAATIATATGARSSMLFIQDVSGYYRPFAAHTEDSVLPADEGISREHPVCQILKDRRLVLREALPALCPQGEFASAQQFFDHHGFALLITFVSQANRTGSPLLGFCGIGEKAGSRRPYSAEELQYLETLSTQAAIAIENANLHQFHLNAQRQLERVNRLQGIEDTVTGLSHELRNPLTSIKMFLQLLPQLKHQEEFVGKYYQQAIREMARIERLVEALISHSRPKPPRFRKSSLNAIIESVVVLHKPRCREKEIELETDLDSTLPHIPLDEDRIRQVLLNLLVNAEEAIGEKGRILIHTRLALMEGVSYVHLTTTDTGRGIPPEQIERIFTPFFTTKERGGDREGLGLGLAIVHRIVHEHSGSITVESQPGKGTTFLILLPVQPQIPQSAQHPEGQVTRRDE